MAEAVGKGPGEGLEPTVVGLPSARAARFWSFARMAAPLRTKSWIAVALISVAGLGFAGCGVKGPLEPPPGAKASGEAKSAEAADPGTNSDAPKKPHEPFVLDPLLR